jgi:hypothetical protein
VHSILRLDTLLKTQPSQLIRSWQYKNRLSRHESLSAFETGLTRHILQHPSALFLSECRREHAPCEGRIDRSAAPFVEMMRTSGSARCSHGISINGRMPWTCNYRTRDDIDVEALMGRGIDGPDHHRSLGEGVQGHWRRSGEKRLAGVRLAREWRRSGVRVAFWKRETKDAFLYLRNYSSRNGEERIRHAQRGPTGRPRTRTCGTITAVQLGL